MVRYGKVWSRVRLGLDGTVSRQHWGMSELSRDPQDALEQRHGDLRCTTRILSAKPLSLRPPYESAEALEEVRNNKHNRPPALAPPRIASHPIFSPAKPALLNPLYLVYQATLPSSAPTNPHPSPSATPPPPPSKAATAAPTTGNPATIVAWPCPRHEQKIVDGVSILSSRGIALPANTCRSGPRRFGFRKDFSARECHCCFGRGGRGVGGKSCCVGRA